MRKWIYIPIFVLMLSGCAQTPAETTAEEAVNTNVLAEAMEAVTEAAAQPYTIKTMLKTQVNDDMHNADINIPQVVFRDSDGLTSAVFEKITEPLMMEYAAYTDSAGIDFNWFTTDYQVYESEEWLALTVLSYRQWTSPNCPNITGAVVDLKTMTLLDVDTLLAARGTDTATLTEQVRSLLPAVWDDPIPVWPGEFTDAFLDENGDLIAVFSTEKPQGDIPGGARLYYNADKGSLSIWYSKQTLDDFSASFRSPPENYVFDQAIFDAYYSEDHIPETMVVQPELPGIEPEIVVLPTILPEVPDNP